MEVEAEVEAEDVEVDEVGLAAAAVVVDPVEGEALVVEEEVVVVLLEEEEVEGGVSLDFHGEEAAEEGIRFSPHEEWYIIVSVYAIP